MYKEGVQPQGGGLLCLGFLGAWPSLLGSGPFPGAHSALALWSGAHKWQKKLAVHAKVVVEVLDLRPVAPGEQSQGVVCGVSLAPTCSV